MADVNAQITDAFSGQAEVFEAPEAFREDAHVKSMDEYRALYQRSVDDPEGFFIVSALEVRPTGTAPESEVDRGDLAGVRVEVSVAGGGKCPRCWTWSPVIGTDSDYHEVCPRCARVLRESGISPDEA